MGASNNARNGYISSGTINDLPLLGRGRGSLPNTSTFMISAAGSTISDIGGNSVSITVTGATTSTSAPFTSTYNSVSFASTASQYLTLGSNSVFNVGTGDFTLECWVYPTANRTYSPIVDTQPAGTAGARTSAFLLYRDTNGAIQVFCNGLFNYSSANGVLPLNTWKHVVLCRFSNAVRIFVDGTLLTTLTTQAIASISLSQTSHLIGRLSDVTPSTSNCFAGLISNYRWIKGNSQYLTSFTSPTSDLSPTPQNISYTRTYGILTVG